MTTLAWDGTTLAADKQATNNGYRAKVTKLRRLKDGSIAGICGDMETGMLVLDWLDGGAKPIWQEKDDFAVALIIKPDKTIWRTEKYLIPWPMEDDFTACGSGRDYALAAMACGKTAIEAVLIAQRFDCNSGMGMDSMELAGITASGESQAMCCVCTCQNKPNYIRHLCNRILPNDLGITRTEQD